MVFKKYNIEIEELNQAIFKQEERTRLIQSGQGTDPQIETVDGQSSNSSSPS